MSDPLQAFEIELPRDVDASTLASLQQALAKTPGVEQCGAGETRSLDPATLTLWVTLAGTAITTLGSSITVLKQVLELFKRKGIRGARLVLANGSVLEADTITAEDLLKVSQGPGAAGAP